MAATNAPISSTNSLGRVLVTGGCGFLGSHIVSLLSERGACSRITALDLRPATVKSDGIDYVFGDITDYDGMLALFQELKPDAVIHTASPPTFKTAKEVLRKVNVDGTKTLVRAAQETGVKAFVYTSSASVISNAEDGLINADERWPVISGKQQTDYYSETKALAELHVLSSNRAASHPQFLTCAIRPSGIFGERDAQFFPNVLAAYYRGQTNFQIGANDNLFDGTYVGNVAHAHHLAAAALLATAESEAPVLEDEKVDGEAFFVTNDSPCYFWDFMRRVWYHAGNRQGTKSIWSISRNVALVIATVLELVWWIFRWGQPTLTKAYVKYLVMTRYYNIDKAKRRLGYRPITSLDEGIRRGVESAIARGVIPGMPEDLKVKKQQ